MEDTLENKISYDIRGAIFKLYNALGPGLIESVYEEVLKNELQKMGHLVETQIPVQIEYDGITFDKGFRMDILVDELVIIELKAVKELAKIDYKRI